jgi:hypothetical protein
MIPAGRRSGMRAVVITSHKAIDIVDLDAVEEHSGVSYIGPDNLRDANFQVIDRSAEARVLKIAVPRL